MWTVNQHGHSKTINARSTYRTTKKGIKSMKTGWNQRTRSGQLYDHDTRDPQSNHVTESDIYGTGLQWK